MKPYLLFLFLIVVFSCKDKSVSSNLELCGVKDPVRNLPWLKTLIDEAKANNQDEHLTITLGKIKGETVINYSLIYMSCIGCVAYHCDGSRLDLSQYTQEEMNAYINSIWNDKGRGLVIWPEK